MLLAKPIDVFLLSVFLQPWLIVSRDTIPFTK